MKPFPKCALIVMCLALMGAGPIGITDVETAVIEKNFEDAKDLAVRFLSQTGEVEIERKEAQYYLGLSQLRLGRYAESRQIFKKLLGARIPSDLAEQTELALIENYYLDGRFPEAEKQAYGMLKKNPDSAFSSLIYLKLARSHLKMAEWKQARGYLEKIVHEFPDSPEYHIAKQLLDEKQYFAVQVGAFLDRQKAQRVANELKDSGEYSYILETTSRDGKKFYRVRVGQATVLSEAQKLESKLSKLGYPTLIYP